MALEDTLAPDGVMVGSLSAASMEVHVGSLMPQIDVVVAMSSALSIRPSPGDPTTLEVSDSSVGIPMGVALSLGDLEPSALVPASLVASMDAAASVNVMVVPALDLWFFWRTCQYLFVELTLLCILPMSVLSFDFCLCRVS